MQSVVAKRGQTSDFAEAGLDQGAMSQRQLDTDDADLMDENVILSRPSLPRKKLELFEAPEFVQRLTNYQEATAGDTVTFIGQYKAFPRPTVKWFKDEEEIRETQRCVIDLSSEANGIVRLIIQEVTLRDEGAYKCKVENQEGVTSTTGYLSVFPDKCPDKGNSNQAKKIAQDKVSRPTSPFLRPIVEQKSVEEREEKEYQHLPPSPLQEFMDKIRHGTKSMNGPVFYADLAGVYPDEDVIRDFENVATEDEVEVFDEDGLNSATPSSSPVEEKDGPGFPTNTPNNDIQVLPTFLSPAPTTVVMETQLSGEDSAYDSDSQDCQTPVIRNGTSGTLGNGTGTGTQSTSGESRQRNRRLKLTLQRAEAVELSDMEPNSGCVTAIDSKFLVNSQTTPGVERQNEDASPFRQEHKEIKGQMETEEFEAKETTITTTATTTTTTALGKEVCTRSAADVVFSWVDTPWYQFLAALIVSAEAMALFGGVPVAYLITAVMVVSVISFVVMEQIFTK